jgi:hypothetical protein
VGKEWQELSALPGDVTYSTVPGTTTATVSGLGAGKIILAVRVVIVGIGEIGAPAKTTVTVKQ